MIAATILPSHVTPSMLKAMLGVGFEPTSTLTTWTIVKKLILSIWFELIDKILGFNAILSSLNKLKVIWPEADPIINCADAVVISA